jgi:uncharacterized membrane protein
MATVHRKRHLAKAITWRIIASAISFFLGWMITGDITAGLKIGAFDVVLKLVAYYAHERIWYRSKFGVDEENEK